MKTNKIYKLFMDGFRKKELERRKEREELKAFIRKRFEEVAIKALRENKNEED